ncbi:hypothetical protein [Derxia gummosa]|uniref:Uncharacterized protein n=1 Tax=Derxia gummosa DSM 723 TaxID=1121388 RepID=A0A8B6X9A8_9BURK|nr:hypothetical protein [Derxia gummosa]
MGCCSGYNFAPAPDAALDPNQRVNFSFGMVLGVDDFRQEHTYLATRDERALRELIGYGAITGLAVGTNVVGTQVEVQVAPGLALLPDGKLVGVAAAQCARLDEWLAGPGKSGADGKTGAASVYVVLRHVEITGTPVPIPGEPCRAEDSLIADSRIADGFTLDFSWTPPSQAEDAALRTFAAWLRRVEVRDAPAPEPSVADFQAAVETQVKQAIANAARWFDGSDPSRPPQAATPLPDPDPAPGGASPEGPTLVIPRARYAEFINAAFDVWVRRLRADAMAHFGPVPAAEATAEAGLLLAAIDITLDAGSLQFPEDVAQTAVARWLGRAQLAHLRLLQEWLLTNAENDAPREADYLLGRFDARLPNAQALDVDFAAHEHAITRVDFIDAPTDAEPEGRKAVLRPAVKWPGGADPAAGGPDYYGPGMSQPIPVSDGGTGQAVGPARGQLLTGVAEVAGTPAHFALGWLRPVQHTPTGTDAIATNLVVDPDSAAPDILIDTIQNLGPLDSPEFAGLTITGALSTDSLEVSGAAHVGDTLGVDGNASVGGALDVTGGAHVDDSLDVGGAATIGGALSVTGDIGAGGSVSAGTAVNAGSDVNAGGNVTAGGGVSATGDVQAGGNVTAEGGIGAKGDIKSEGTVHGEAGLSSGATLSVAGDATISGVLDLGQPLAAGEGGTGLDTPPRKQQVLVGHPDDSGRYVLANLADSPSVIVRLQQTGASPPAPEEWTLSFDAVGGNDSGSGGLALPVATGQGGTGTADQPAFAQILSGNGEGAYDVGDLRPAVAGRHITVSKVEKDITIDTTPQTHWALRVVSDMTKGNALTGTDHVVVIAQEGDKLEFNLGPAQEQRVVTVKSALLKSPVTLLAAGTVRAGEGKSLIDTQETLVLEPQRSVTLIGHAGRLAATSVWYVIGRA